MTVRQLEVKTSLLTLFFKQAYITLFVPYTAGLISSFSSLGTPGGIGEAT